MTASDKIMTLMSDKRWRTAGEISERLNVKIPSVNAVLRRELRKGAVVREKLQVSQPCYAWKVIG